MKKGTAMPYVFAHQPLPASFAPTHANSVEDMSSTHTALQRHATLTNGVVQGNPDEDKRFFDSAFVYKSAELNGWAAVAYEAGKIAYTKYGGNLGIRSNNFNGCYMMVFSFNRTIPNCENVETGVNYVAHVANGPLGDARCKLVEAEKIGLIKIERIFRPYRTDEDVRDFSPIGGLTEAQSSVKKLTASVDFVSGDWVADVYRQERIPYGTVIDGRIGFENPNAFDWYFKNIANRRLSGTSFVRETNATMAYIYAYVMNCAGSSSDLKEYAESMLNALVSNNRNAVEQALSVTESRDPTYCFLQEKLR